MAINESAFPVGFLNKIIKTDSCWVWDGAISSSGYGSYWCKSKNYLPHRFLYERVNGKIKDNLKLDHLCRNKICVNPKHLEIVTQRENIMRGNCPTSINAHKTHCINGHILSSENIFESKSKNGFRKRQCKICTRNSQIKFYSKMKKPKTKQYEYLKKYYSKQAKLLLQECEEESK